MKSFPKTPPDENKNIPSSMKRNLFLLNGMKMYKKLDTM
jgi:hypothetical protein